jgi:hypothetical protein
MPFTEVASHISYVVNYTGERSMSSATEEDIPGPSMIDLFQAAPLQLNIHQDPPRTLAMLNCETLAVGRMVGRSSGDRQGIRRLGAVGLNFAMQGFHVPIPLA